MDIRSVRIRSAPSFEGPSGSTVPAAPSAAPTRQRSAESQIDGPPPRDRGKANHLFLRLPRELMVPVVDQMTPDSRLQFALAHSAFERMSKPALEADFAQKCKAGPILIKIEALGDDPAKFHKILSEVQKLEEFFQAGPLARLARTLFRNERETKRAALMDATAGLSPECRAMVLSDMPSQLLSGYASINLIPQTDANFHIEMDELMKMVVALPPPHQPEGIVGLAKATAFPGNEREFEQLISMLDKLSPQHQAAALPGLIKAICMRLPPLSEESSALRSTLSRLTRRPTEIREISVQHAFQRKYGAGKRGGGVLWNMLKALPDPHRSSALIELADIVYLPKLDRRDGFATVFKLIEGLPGELQAKPLAKLVSRACTIEELSHAALKDIIKLTKKIPQQDQRPVLDELKEYLSDLTGDKSYNKDRATVDKMLDELAPR